MTNALELTHPVSMPPDLPSGTVTFLFTDIEGSTKLLRELGAEGYADALTEHRRILRDAFVRHGGVEVDTQGDAFFVAFPAAPAALTAAAEARDALASGPIRVRIGLHTGTPHMTAEGYVGADVHRAARIAAAGHGGQVLVSAATAALVDTDGLRDLGAHRLKDLSAPERIHQLGPDEFPPLKSLHGSNLPVPTTAFLGREHEVSEVLALVTRDDIRLVTLTGPGGTGKTRLALQSAGASADAFAGGVWWVSLTPLRDPSLVAPTAAQALGVSGDLADHIADRAMLMLFDNFEHLLDAAGDVARLLDACPNLKVLATSREPLRISGEWQYAVDPLRDTEAVDLFTTRASAARRDFEADAEVRQICRRLDNLPLAIELAAARVKVLSTRALLERLERRLPVLTGGARDAPGRQRTLRATIEWSYDLLSTAEQRLFARLAVFRGGCTPEAAEEVADADLDTLQSLVDKSLVRHRDDRYWMLETIREYAAERLEGSPDADAVLRAHAQHFLSLAEEAEPHLGGSPREWADRLELEHDNVRAANDRLEASGEIELSLRLAGAMAPFWYLRNHVVEGRRRLEGLLPRDRRPTVARAKALAAAATMAFGEADVETATARAEEALDLYRQLGDPSGTAHAAMLLGNALSEGAKPADTMRGIVLLEQSVQGFREVGDVESELRATYNLATAVADVGEHERWRSLLEDMLRRARALGLERDQAMALGGLSAVARREGRFRDAVLMLADCTRIEHELGDLAWTANNLGRLAHTLALEGGAERAGRVLGTAEALRERIGLLWPQWAVEMNEETRTAIRAQLDEAAFTEASEQGRILSVDEAVGLALEEPQPASATPSVP